MNIVKLLSMLLFGHNKHLIINSDMPICNNCKHIITHDSYGRLLLGKCNIFGTMNLVTGTVDYKYADTCRSFDMYCGEKGKYFVPKDASQDDQNGTFAHTTK